jgi:predicted ATP-binding protein involved in virulence
MGNQNFVLKLDELKLKNFRDLEDFKVTLHEQLTVFISENGGGKTTVLDSIAGCLNYLRSRIGIGFDNPPHTFLKSDIAFGKEALDIDLTFKGRLASFYLTANYGKTDLYTSFSSERKDLNNISDDKETLETHLDDLSQNHQLNIPIIAYYPSRYEAAISNKSIDDSLYLHRFSAYEHALDEEVMNFKMLKKWLVNQSNLDIYEENEDDNRVFEAIKEALIGETGLLNDEKERLFTDFRVSFRGIHRAEGNFLFTKRRKKIYDYQLSSGERMLMVLVADLARRAVLATPFSKTPLKDATGVVLIDEIDLHLHPRWQRTVLSKLMNLFKNIQFVVTTHSPMMLTGIKTHQVRIIKDSKAYMVGELLPDFRNYGADIDKIIEIMQDVKDYMPKEVADLFQQYFNAINTNDLMVAKQLEIKLQNLTDPYHPDILRGQAEIEYKRLLEDDPY